MDLAPFGTQPPGRRRGAAPPRGRWTLLGRAYGPLGRVERAFLRMRNFAGLLEQLLFLTLADKLLLGPRRPAASRISSPLYTLTFYNVAAYILGYVGELLGPLLLAQRASVDSSPYVTLTETSRIVHLAMTTTKLVLEWTKAVAFLATLAFAIVLLALEQALHYYKPSLLYIIITWTYYLATEKAFIDVFTTLLSYFQLEALEGLENLYSPVILRVYTMLLSAIFILLSIPSGSWRFIFVTAYLNVFLRCKELIQIYWAALKKECETLKEYRTATLEEIKSFEDVCAVCLSPMKKARVTPCQHLFHASCLRQCLKIADYCPLCKQELIFS